MSKKTVTPSKSRDYGFVPFVLRSFHNKLTLVKFNRSKNVPDNMDVSRKSTSPIETGAPIPDYPPYLIPQHPSRARNVNTV